MADARAVARVNLAAIERNAARLRRELEPHTALCAVVKADGYGHGARPSAHAALEGGASWLAVATAAEARELREGGVSAPLLVLGALIPAELEIALAAEADVVAWSETFVSALRGLGGGRVHVKLDTGMGRLGTPDPVSATRVADAVAAAPELQLVGAMTHFATADERGDSFFGEQLARFSAWAAEVRNRHPQVMLHAANSAATLRDSHSRFDMVRCGVAVYGLDPYGEDPAVRGLDPALALHSYVAAVKPRGRGESAGYGRRFIAQRDTVLAVVPVGYGDGWRRGLTNNADVLIGGRRHPLVGTVSMDNITVDLGPSADASEGRVQVGDLAVLIGSYAQEQITAEELAVRLQTINYEITCGLGARIPRAYHRDGAPVAEAPAASAPGTGPQGDAR